MFRKLRTWLRENREWHRRWKILWPPLTEPGPDGITPFQRRAQTVLGATVPAGLEPLSWSRKGTREPYLTSSVPGTALTCWLYKDTAEISGAGVHKIFEAGGYAEPEELLTALEVVFREYAGW